MVLLCSATAPPRCQRRQKKNRKSLLAVSVGLVGLEPMTSTMSSDLETLEITAFASLFACPSHLLQNCISVLFLRLSQTAATFRLSVTTF